MAELWNCEGKSSNYKIRFFSLFWIMFFLHFLLSRKFLIYVYLAAYNNSALLCSTLLCHLFYSTLFYSVLSCLVLSCLVLSYLVLSCLVLSCLVLFCLFFFSFLLCFCTIPFFFMNQCYLFLFFFTSIRQINFYVS